MSIQISKKESILVEQLVDHYIANKNLFPIILESLHSYVEHNEKLQKLIHSKKSRIKDSDHLRDKLKRKINEAKEKEKKFDITKDNLFSKINDLAGFRILHLHTTQFKEIDILLKEILAEQKWKIIEGPNARTWDDETRDYFKSIGIKTSANKNMYTSVHYIIRPNNRNLSCEIQVRTLAEEIWGEADHKINYPHKTKSHSCKEQIKTLARVTSSCSRLVDSIFSTFNYENEKENKKPINYASKKIVKKTKK